MKLFIVLVIGFSVAAVAAEAAEPEVKKTFAAARAEGQSRFSFLWRLLAGGASAISKTLSSVGLALGGSDEQQQPAQPIVLEQVPPPHPLATFLTKYALQPSPLQQQQPCPVPLFPGGCPPGQVCAMVTLGLHQCVSQHADGASCVTNFECFSGTCYRNHCVINECRSVGQQSSCLKGQECVASDSGNKCVESGTSNECPMPLSVRGCGEMQYCTVGIKGNVCASKLSVNSECISWVQCLSGSCRHGKCKNDACPMLDTSIDCMPTQYCTSSKDGNMCVARKENGALCSVGAQCQSEVCRHGVCMQDDCLRRFTQDRCLPSHFCSPGQNGNRCAMKKTPGTGCHHHVQCQSHVCRHSICVADQCPTPLATDRCDMSTEFCMFGVAGNKCVTKLDNGMVCLVFTQCMSNNCDMGICKPNAPVRLSIGEICSLATECVSFFCVLNKCAETQMSLGGRCLAASDCQSLICTNNVCVSPETTAPQTTTTPTTTPPTTTPQTTTPPTTLMTTTSATTTTTTTTDPPLVVCGNCNVASECDTGTCAAAGAAEDTCDCPAGFTLCAGRCLQFLGNFLAYSSAEAACEAIGAHLATPRSLEEDQCVNQVFDAAAGAFFAERNVVERPPWLGYRSDAAGQPFVGADDCGPITYSNFATGSPSGGSDDDNCVFFDFDSFWGVTNCAAPSQVMCQLADCLRPQC